MNMYNVMYIIFSVHVALLISLCAYRKDYFTLQVLHVFMRGAILLTELSVVIFGLFFSE